MRKRSSTIITLLLCVMALVLTGCWDRMEIEDRAVVLAIAVDQSNDTRLEGANSTHLNANPVDRRPLYRLTVQIAVPGRLPLGPGGSGDSGGDSGDQSPVWELQIVGHTMEDAMKNMQQELADRLFLGHLRVIVVSEEVARSGLENINDFLRRQPQVRRTAWMVVSRGGSR